MNAVGLLCVSIKNNVAIAELVEDQHFAYITKEKMYVNYVKVVQYVFMKKINVIAKFVEDQHIVFTAHKNIDVFLVKVVHYVFIKKNAVIVEYVMVLFTVFTESNLIIVRLAAAPPSAKPIYAKQEATKNTKATAYPAQ